MEAWEPYYSKLRSEAAQISENKKIDLGLMPLLVIFLRRWTT
jgi:hypothetical protein